MYASFRGKVHSKKRTEMGQGTRRDVVQLCGFSKHREVKIEQSRGNYAAFSSVLQAAQRLAANGIDVRHSGQSCIETSLRRTLFTNFTRRKITKTTITKLTTSLINAPYAITGIPFAFASASETGTPFELSRT